MPEIVNCECGQKPTLLSNTDDCSNDIKHTIVCSYCEKKGPISVNSPEVAIESWNIVRGFFLHKYLLKKESPNSPFDCLTSFVDHHGKIIKKAFEKSGDIDSALSLWYMYLCGAVDCNFQTDDGEDKDA